MKLMFPQRVWIVFTTCLVNLVVIYWIWYSKNICLKSQTFSNGKFVHFAYLGEYIKILVFMHQVTFLQSCETINVRYIYLYSAHSEMKIYLKSSFCTDLCKSLGWLLDPMPSCNWRQSISAVWYSQPPNPHRKRFNIWTSHFVLCKSHCSTRITCGL